ncbi:MAG: hypothetical protein OQJ96_01435 [Flavobacteriales bacterium]|nr:hypothetical protein [Flavobacteriales bacterium]MCW8912585.1 hypothetical protein [Flavobacteriales bacterium]MCW8938190.1 hypothetical protein [Flavobacteriales bacterium]MCW8941022.1 hypothetical protein [Flavobacteriales bacterium]MCW8967018.1 hypothetical protein [Flavobacteriales bacterium]
MSKVKHFLDTSILRPIHSSSSEYKKYLNNNLGKDRYISHYIQKEFVNGLIIPMMSFYSLLRMKHITSVADALSVWNNKFNSRELKSINVLVVNLLSSHYIDLNDLRKKDSASKLIADYIRRLLSLLELRFKFIGVDNNLCVKTKLVLDYDLDKLDNIFSQYLKDFKKSDDSKICNINTFFKTHSSQIDKIQKSTLNIDKTDRSGLEKIQKNIKSINNNMSCVKCAKLGDMIISILTPSNMRLEHTDNSFDYLMELLEKTHYKHPSELAIQKKAETVSK